MTTARKIQPTPRNAEEARRPERAKRNGSVSKIVLEYAMQHQGVLIHVNDIAKDTGLTEQQVRAAIRKMTEEEKTGTWEVALRGSAWTFTPKSNRREGDWILLEVVAAIKDSDKRLVRAEDGSFAVLSPVTL